MPDNKTLVYLSFETVMGDIDEMVRATLGWAGKVAFDIVD